MLSILIYYIYIKKLEFVGSYLLFTEGKHCKWISLSLEIAGSADFE